MFVEPLEIYTDLGVFGEEVLIDGRVIHAVVDYEFLPENAFSISVANADPFLIVRSDDVADYRQGDEIYVVVREHEFTANSIEHDGTGMAVVQLRRLRDAPDF